MGVSVLTLVLFDGDIISYTSAFHAQASENTQEEAKRKIDSTIRWTLALLDATEYKVFLTGKGNFRYEVNKTYKAQRTAPKPSLLPWCREYLRWEWGAVVGQGEEADDLIAMEAARMNYQGCVIASVDKDFLQVPVPMYNFRKGELTQVSPEEGIRFFYKQCIMGDSADGVKGIPGVGPVGAEKALEGVVGEKNLYNTVLRLYEEHGLSADDLTSNARLLWLRRKPNEMWKPPNG